MGDTTITAIVAIIALFILAWSLVLLGQIVAYLDFLCKAADRLLTHLDEATGGKLRWRGRRD